MKIKKKNKSVDIYFILILIFVILKLTGQIDWAWWAVLLPLWIQLTGILAVVLLWVMGGLDE